MEIWEKFFENLSRIEVIKAAAMRAVLDWGEDIPITLLFSRLGVAIVDNFDDISFDDRVYIFFVIEQAMSVGDECTKSLVASGLLEAIGNRIVKDDDLARRIGAQMGDVTKKYLVDLDSWHKRQ